MDYIHIYIYIYIYVILGSSENPLPGDHRSLVWLVLQLTVYKLPAPHSQLRFCCHQSISSPFLPHSGSMSSWQKFFSADLQLALQTSENPCQIFQESFLRQFLSLWLKVKGKPPSSLWVGQAETTAHRQVSTSLENTLCILGLSSWTCSVADEQRTAAGFIASVLVMLHLQLLASGTCPKTFRPEEQLCLTSSYTSMTQKRSLLKEKKN